MSDSFLNRFVRLLPAAALLLCVATAPEAHHSFAAQYDNNKPLTMTGALTKLEWTNPHVYIFIDVTDPRTNKVTNWAFEMGPPHMLQKSGWKRNALKTGELLTIDGWAARDGGNSGNARRVTRKSTGEVMGAASSIGQTSTGAGAAQ
jgi:Family of unknown function (DUF6152)